MTETDQCGIETRKDGTKICSLHKQPLVETTELEQRLEGKDYAKWETFFECSVSKKVFGFRGF